MNNFTAVIFGIIIFLLAIIVAERITEERPAPNADPAVVAERIRPVGILRTVPASLPPLSSDNPPSSKNPELPTLTVPSAEPLLPPPVSVLKNDPPATLPPQDVPARALPEAPQLDNFASGRNIYIAACFSCHETGAAGAPKRGDRPAWRQRKTQGRDLLLAHILNGFNNMPPHAGNPNLSVEEINLALSYLLH